MPGDRAALDAIVLAGGRAARLGGPDKPRLLVGGRALLSWVLAAAAAAGAARIVVVGPDRPASLLASPDLPASVLAGPVLPAGPGHPGGPPEVRVVREEPPGAGPVAALRRGLAEVSAPLVALLAADLPFLRAAQLQLLADALGPARPDGGGLAGALLLDDTGQAQWLTSCWRTAVLRGALGSYRGNSLHGLLRPLGPAGLRLRLAAGQPPPWLDCDTPDDLRRARAWTEQTEQEAPGEHARPVDRGGLR